MTSIARDYPTETLGEILQGVHAEGRLDGLMLAMTLRQRYRNDSRHNIEAVYTFPLAHGVTLLGLQVEIGGKRLRAQVIAAPEARERFEDAIDAGDSPVMVEQTGNGLYTANLGNLLPGESLDIELEYAQLLRFEQGRIRLTVPTVIAERYGNPQAPGRLRPHETTASSASADYDFSLRLRLCGAVARAKVSSPSHHISTALFAEGCEVTLDHGGRLDRDFILNLEGLWGLSFAARAADGDTTAVLASFCPALRETPQAPVALKVLVDCSGSMGGDSIASAKAALHEIFQQMGPRDYVAYSRFGGHLVNHHPALIQAGPGSQAALAQLVARTEADLGSTEMESALQGVLTGVRVPPAAAELNPVVLLITDGQVWAVDEMVALARKSSHRLFVIGVGVAPGEGLLQQLAEATGGAFEAVSPNEDMTGGIVRMFHRLRGAPAARITVDWGATPLWQTPPPSAIYDGETLHLFALFRQPPLVAPRLRWVSGGQPVDCAAEAMTQPAGDSLRRLCGARQLALCEDARAATALALNYQLVSAHTTLFLVYERAVGEKADGLPTLHQIAQMQAAGQFGVGTVREMPAPARFSRVLMTEHPAQSEASYLAASYRPTIDRLDLSESCGMEAPPSAWDDAPVEHAAVAALFTCFNQFAPAMPDLATLVARLILRPEAQPFGEAIGRLQALGFEHVAAWALLLNWLEGKFIGASLERHAARLLRQAMREAPRSNRRRAVTELAALF